MTRLMFAPVAVFLAAALGHLVWQAIGVWSDALWASVDELTPAQMAAWSLATSARDQVSSAVSGVAAFFLLAFIGPRPITQEKTMAVLTPDQKKLVAPIMGLIVWAVSIGGAYIAYEATGGTPIPVLDQLAPFLAAGAIFLVIRNATKNW